MAEVSNGTAPTEEAKKLLRRDYNPMISALGEMRVVNRSMLLQAVGQFDPEWISLPRLYQMRRDPMIKLGMYFIKATLVRAKWHIECSDPRVQAGMTEIVKQGKTRWYRVMLNRMDFGFQAAIKQFELGNLEATYEDPDTGVTTPVWDGNIKPLVLAPPINMPPDYVTVNLEKDGTFNGFKSQIGSGIEIDKNQPGIVPSEWAVWRVSEFEENFNNYYGYPRTGYAYRYWWSSWFRHHLEDRHFEQDADPSLQIWYPPGDHDDGTGSGKRINNRDTALSIGNDLRSGSTVAMPSDVHVDEQGKATTTPLWKAEFMKGGENIGAFLSSAEYLDVMKLRAVLVPEQGLIEGKGGTSSRNVMGSAQVAFEKSLAVEADDEDDYWNRYMIPQLKEANFGADAPECRIKTTGFDEEDLTLAQDLIKAAFQVDPNALPIDFEELVRKAQLPVLTKEEEQQRNEELQKEAEAHAQAAADAGLGPPPGGPPGPPGGGPPGAAQAGLSLHVRTRPQHARQVQSTAPQWARAEHDRRNKNTMALAERLEAVAHDRYRAAYEETARFLEQDANQVNLGIRDWSRDFGDRLRAHLSGSLRHYTQRLKAELASMFHASGAAEINRLGLNMDNWDVGREEPQGYADDRANFLQLSIDSTVVDDTLTWISKELAKIHGPEHDSIPEGYKMPFDEAHNLAQELRKKFTDMPDWQARRLARTEARTTYNNAGFQIWDWAGINNVRAYDGLGGLSGKTDPTCLARNGEVMTLAQAREEDATEHMNGTLGFVPVLEEGQEPKDIPPGNLSASAVQSDQIYAVDSSGLILSLAEAGKLVGAGTPQTNL